MAGKAGLEQYDSFVHVHTPWVAREANDELVVLKLWVPSEMDSVAGGRREEIRYHRSESAQGIEERPA